MFIKKYVSVFLINFLFQSYYALSKLLYLLRFVNSRPCNIILLPISAPSATPLPPSAIWSPSRGLPYSAPIIFALSTSKGLDAIPRITSATVANVFPPFLKATENWSSPPPFLKKELPPPELEPFFLKIESTLFS